MKHIKNFKDEHITKSIKHLKNVVKGYRKFYKGELEWLQKQPLYFENAYVVNGSFFPYGVEEVKGAVVKPDKDLKNEMRCIIRDVRKEFKDDCIIPICYEWLFNSSVK